MTNYELFLSVFHGRRDVVPKYYDFVTAEGERKTGYSPICALAGKPKCPKKQGVKISCSQCAQPVYVPMSETLLKKHLNGREILGIYPIIDGDMCRQIAGDFDNHDGRHDPLADVKKFREVCEMQEIPCHVLRSKSGKGHHVYLFFEEPVKNRKARAVYFALLREAGIIGDDFIEDAEDSTRTSSFDRVFPAQDDCYTGKQLGNLIALPFQGIANGKFTGNTAFLMPDCETPAEDQWKYLSEIQRVSEAQLDALIAEWKLDLTVPAKQPAGPGGGKKDRINPLEVIAGLPHGERDDKLFRYACRLRSQGLSVPEIEVLVCHAGALCTPVFTRSECLAKITSAMNYDCAPVSVPENDAWVQDALKPQTGDARFTAGRRLASYWLQEAGGDMEKVRLSLFGWNIPNSPPLSPEELELIISGAGSTQGVDTFRRVTGVPLSHTEMCKFPDGTAEFRLFITGLASPAQFTSAELLAKPTFCAKILSMTRIVPKIPEGKGSTAIWRELVTGITSTSAITEMPEAMTVMDRLRQVIKTQIRDYGKNDPNPEANIETKIIIYRDQIMFKMNTLMMRCFYDASEELKRLSRREISDLLVRMGFQPPTKNTRIGKKTPQVFKIPVNSFRGAQNA